ncbi:DUF5327 family protein [Staphylococcus hyicus]|uniref:DUF5327 family protein n=1 Tax=Staphylococcus hyicus TaxID=1284 RepID=UPI00208F16A3|nr:DUF5327 family protein [Staphylococcus hyicus]MCO4329093.1 YwdI family protein [Staphylococcus hyicus]MCO4332476.1 YwdI family protein [Staphylococcus hyicus]MCO4334876.1 YwdI family protein [Staphylococcus hyicus]MCO4335372.1 YwdI family protein [Staphylococcus hyicus]
MNKEKMIELIEAELVKADASQTNSEFEKHMYAIHTLTSLYTSGISQPASPSLQQRGNKPLHASITPSSAHTVTDEEIRLMGGKVSTQSSPPTTTPSNPRMVTDDELGNGESLFDF